VLLRYISSFCTTADPQITKTITTTNEEGKKRKKKEKKRKEKEKKGKRKGKNEKEEEKNLLLWPPSNNCKTMYSLFIQYHSNTLQKPQEPQGVCHTDTVKEGKMKRIGQTFCMSC